MQLSFEKKGNTEDDKHVGKHAWTPGGGGRGVKLSFGHGFKDEGVTFVELFLDGEIESYRTPKADSKSGFLCSKMHSNVIEDYHTVPNIAFLEPSI